MNLRTFNIGARLGAGFGIILLLSGGMLVATRLAGEQQRDAILLDLRATSIRAGHATAMEVALLRSAVAVRNMGMQSAVDDVQRDEAKAKKFRGDYLQARRLLEATDLGDEEKAALQRLQAIDALMDADFKEAVDLAASFNNEQAAAVITKKIDPLLTKSNTELAAIVQLQQRREVTARDAATASARRSGWQTLGASLALLLGAAVLAWRVTLSITQPLRDAAEAATRVAHGELDFRIDSRGRDESSRLLAAIGAMRDSLAGVVANVRANSESVATASREIAQGNSDLSSRTEQQASALQETASSMEQLGNAVRHNADNAHQANQLAAGATRVAATGGEVAQRVAQTMKGINDSSRRIADIIGTIDGIAFQTNILALNAAVEAARAGEQGRGFAVVASEVRALAQRSTAAAREIKTLISDSVERVALGTSLVDQSGETMLQIVQSIQRVTDIVAQIGNASEAQSLSVTQVCEAVTQMDRATQQNAALVEQSAAAAESLKIQADHLVHAVAVFQLAPQAA